MSEVLREETPVRERFTIDNDMKAEWVLSKIRATRSEQKRQRDELARQMQFYQDQMDMIDKQADEEVAWFESMLMPYLDERVESGFAKTTKTQTAYKLPTGKIMLKKPSPTFERDNAELLPWLKENHPDLVKIEESPNWAELKKTVKVMGENVVTADGEVVPGVKVTEHEAKFEVEVY